jgi:hypothetical protein
LKFIKFYTAHFIILICCLCSCQNKKQVKTDKIINLTQKESSTGMKIVCIDSATYRQSYALKEKHISNLALTNFSNDSIRIKFGQSKFMKDGYLQLGKFHIKDSLFIKTNTGNDLLVQTSNEVDLLFGTLRLAHRGKVFDFRYTKDNRPKGYALYDIKSGGLKEIITVTNYFISGGDNYEVCIYEIKL